MTNPEHMPQDNVSRRHFVELCIGGMAVTSAGAVAYPVVSFLGRPTSLEGSQIVRIPVSDLSEDQAKYVDWQGQQIAVIFTEKKPKAFSASCSHLGCLVAWDNVKHVFRCPCHGAVFDDQGRPVSGPVSKALTEIPFQVADGHVVIG